MNSAILRDGACSLLVLGVVTIVLVMSRESRPLMEPGFNGAWSTGRELIFVGDDGVIVATEKGTQWNRRKSPYKGDLSAIWGDSDGSTLFVAGNEGVILRSTNRGGTWKRVHADRDIELWSIWGRSATNVYAVGRYREQSGSVLLSTQDGGRSWRTQELDAWAAVAVWCTDRSVFMIVDDRVHRSRDGGATWQVLDTVPGDTFDGWARGALMFTAGADGRIYRSFDDGDSWTISECEGEYGDRIVSFQLHKDVLYAAGGRGLICASTDLGGSWQREVVTTERAAALYALVANRHVIIAAGEDGTLLARAADAVWRPVDPAPSP